MIADPFVESGSFDRLFGDRRKASSDVARKQLFPLASDNDTQRNVLKTERLFDFRITRFFVRPV